MNTLQSKTIGNTEYWVDENNNWWSKENYTKEQAEKALESLVDCYHCIDCVDCWYCFQCIRCDGCDNCMLCTASKSCNACMQCYKCTKCEDCHSMCDCKNCKGCMAVQYWDGCELFDTSDIRTRLKNRKVLKCAARIKKYLFGKCMMSGNNYE